MSTEPQSPEGASTSPLAETLKSRIVELEQLAARDKAKVQRMSAEHEKLTGELLTANKNVEILQGNVETLKSLAMQLATQLEEANSRVETMRDLHGANVLREKRDNAQQLSELRQEYEERLDSLRETLEEQQRNNDNIRETFEGHQDRLIFEHAQTLRERDAMITELQQKIEMMGSRARPIVPTTTRRSSSRKRSTGATLASSAAVGPKNAWDAMDEHQHQVLSLTIAMHTDDMQPQRADRPDRALEPTRYFVDINADPITLDQVPEVNLQASRGFDDPRTGARGKWPKVWRFLTSSGEMLGLSLDISPID